MIKHKLVLRFPASLVEQPLIYRLVKDYDLMVNILRADINPRKEGRLVMEVSGREEKYQQALQWLRDQGLRITNLQQQVIWRSDRCTQCGACSVICPTGALAISRPSMAIRFYEDKCVACEHCIKACPARAMEIYLNNGE
ncbi:MAG: 4Fe-4S binding protein [Firmicutes bacterium]|nr:4Fe-4S binding protein [Bacillota bacterium]